MNENIIDVSVLNEQEIINQRLSIVKSLSNSISVLVKGYEQLEKKDYLTYCTSKLIDNRKHKLKKALLENTKNKKSGKKSYDWLFYTKDESHGVNDKYLEENKELSIVLKKNVFNKKFYKENLKTNILSFVFYERSELSKEDILYAIDCLSKREKMLDYINGVPYLLNQDYYINDVEFFNYLLSSKEQDLLTVVLRQEKFEDYIDTFINSLKLCNTNLNQYFVGLVFEHLKHEGLIKMLFEDKSIASEIIKAFPASMKYASKSLVKYFTKDTNNQETIKKVLQHYDCFSVFEPSDLHFIKDKELIKKICLVHKNFIDNKIDVVWHDPEVIAYYLCNTVDYNTNNCISEHYMEKKKLSLCDSLEYFKQLTPSVDSLDFLHLLLDMKLGSEKSKSADVENSFLNILRSPLFYKYIENTDNRDIFEKVCKIQMLNSPDIKKSDSTFSYYYKPKLEEDSVDNHLKKLIFPVPYLSDVDYCIELESKYALLNLEKLFEKKLIYSRKYALYHLEKACRYSQDLAIIKSNLSPVMFNFFKKIGVEKNCLSFLRTYFEKKALQDTITNSAGVEIELGSINDKIVSSNIKKIKTDIQEKVDNKKVVKL